MSTQAMDQGLVVVMMCDDMRQQLPAELAAVLWHTMMCLACCPWSSFTWRALGALQVAVASLVWSGTCIDTTNIHCCHTCNKISRDHLWYMLPWW